MTKHPTFDPPRYPWITAITRYAVSTAIAAALAAAWLTAGPGNGYQPTRPPTHVTLPTVVIVGKKEQPTQQMVGSASKKVVHTVSTHATP